MEHNKKFENVEIPNEIYGIKLGQFDIDKLKNGGETGLLENMNINGENKTGKAKIYQDKEGEYKIGFVFYKAKLDLSELKGRKISIEEQNNLINGKAVYLGKHEIFGQKQDIFVSIDKELNRITYTASEQIGLPQELAGGYKLTEQDNKLIAEGKQLDTKVLKGNDNNYFLANLSMDLEAKRLHYSNYQEIKPHELKMFIEKYNKIDQSAHKDFDGDGILDKYDKEIDSLRGKEVNSDGIAIEQSKELEQAINDKNYPIICKLTENGEEIKESTIKTIKEDKNLSNTEKVAILTSLQEKPDKVMFEKKEEKNKQIQKNKGVEKTVQGVGEAVKQAFS